MFTFYDIQTVNTVTLTRKKELQYARFSVSFQSKTERQRKKEK